MVLARSPRRMATVVYAGAGATASGFHCHPATATAPNAGIHSSRFHLLFLGGGGSMEYSARTGASAVLVSLVIVLGSTAPGGRGCRARKRKESDVLPKP